MKPLKIDTFQISSKDLKKVEFLDLSYNLQNYNIISLSNQKFICRFDKEFKHTLHSENKHLNSLTDLVISLGLNLEQYDNSIRKSIETIARSLGDKNKLLKQLVENFDFLKDQNNQILTTLFTLRNNLPDKKLINELKFLLETNKPKAIEVESKRLLEKIKLQTLDFESKIKRVEELLATVKNIVES